VSEFEKGRKAFQRDLIHQPYADPSYLTNVGLSVVAEGLAEVIALLRPLVDTATAQLTAEQPNSWLRDGNDSSI
jgi:limonene-1,2-epoxide hydrolase